MKPTKRIIISENLDTVVTLVGTDNGDGVYLWNLNIDHQSNSGSVVTMNLIIKAPFNLTDLGTRLIKADENYN